MFRVQGLGNKTPRPLPKPKPQEGLGLRAQKTLAPTLQDQKSDALTQTALKNQTRPSRSLKEPYKQDLDRGTLEETRKGTLAGYNNNWKKTLIKPKKPVSQAYRNQKRNP